MPDITSRQHPLVHAFRSAARGASDALLLDGWHLLHDAVAAGVEISTIALDGAPPTPRDAAVIDALSRGADVFTVTTAVMNAMSPVRTPAGVVALAARRTYHLADVLRPPALAVIASDIQDPGNAGAIVRSAEAGGGTGVIFVGASANPWGWKALRAAMGSTFRLPVVQHADVQQVFTVMQHAHVRLIATVPRGGIDMYNLDLRASVAFLLGAEGGGLDESLISAAAERMSIPMQSPVESLNVAVAAALMIYEGRRQRRA